MNLRVLMLTVFAETCLAQIILIARFKIDRG
jgi:hypothetical protein